MKVQITNGMFMALIINMVYAKSIGLTQGSMSREIGSDMWIATIFGTVFGGIMIFLVIKTIKRMPRGDLLDQGSTMLGKWIGKLISLCVLVFFLSGFGPVIITFIYHLKDYFLPEGPILLFVVVTVVIGAYAINFGIEVIARMALIGIFSILSLNILVLLGSIQEFDIRELLPVFSSNLPDILWASRHHGADWALAIMMVAVILPIVKEKETWGKSGIMGVVFGGAFILMWPILEAGVLSPEVTASYIVSCMQMARSAQLGVFIHRYEMIMVAFYALSSLTQIMVSLLCGSIAMQKLFGKKDYRPMIIPAALIFGGYGYWVVFDHQRAMQILEVQWVWIALSIAIILPSSLYLLGFIFKKKLNQKSSDNKEK